jgi:hypothetical protein
MIVFHLTYNSIYFTYIYIYICLHDAVRRHRPEKWRSGNRNLHRDNAPAYRAVTTNEFLAKHKFSSLPHPPYSPDLAPYDFFCSRNWRKQWKVADSITLKRFKPTWRDIWGLLQKMIIRGALVSDRNAGISAYKHKDTTLKETRPTSR